MPSEPSLSDRYRNNAQIDAGNIGLRSCTQESAGMDGGNVVVMTENAEEVSIANLGVAF